MKKYLIFSLLYLTGCQGTSLDDQKNIQESIDMTFCGAGGLKKFTAVVKHGGGFNISNISGQKQLAFVCRNGLTGILRAIVKSGV